MHYKPSPSRVAFQIINGIVLAAITLLGIIPFIHLLAVSFSSNSAAVAGQVRLWPVEFTWDAYVYLGQKAEFFQSLWVSMQRVVLGTIISMLLCVLSAYPLSRETSDFKSRTAYVWFFVITMFFGGGLIPTYMVVKNAGLLNTIWALIIPGALSVWNMVMLLNFFRIFRRIWMKRRLWTVPGTGRCCSGFTCRSLCPPSPRFCCSRLSATGIPGSTALFT